MKTEQAINEVTTKTTMRELLERWAKAEPARCRVETLPDNLIEFLVTYGGGTFIVFTSNNAGCRYWRTENDSLMRIQWTVQQAIVARGWPFELSYYSVLGNYDAEIDIDSHQSFCREGDNPAEALLAVYLRALEASK